MADSEEDEDEDKRATRPKVARSSDLHVSAKKKWKVLQGAVLKGRFRGLSYPIAGQDSPFYWESMFSSEGENVEYSVTRPMKPGSTYYYSGPGPPAESSPTQVEQEDVIVEDVVTRGERSGSFLFPSTKSDEEDTVTQTLDEQERDPLSPPLQISPAPEEYYTLVPITPFTPMSPLKDRKQRDPAVSWHVPETYTSHGRDVVQALAESYTDPRIVTTANLRPNIKKRRSPDGSAPQPTSTDSDRGKLVRDKDEGRTRKTKRRYEKVKKQAGHKKGRRKVTPPKYQKQDAEYKQEDPDGKSKTQKTKAASKKKTKHLFRIRAKLARTLSSSSEEEDSNTDARNHHLRKTPQDSAASKPEHSKEAIVFEAQDLEGPFIPPLKDRAQSVPIMSSRRLMYMKKNDTRRTPRQSVSMSDVKDSHIDSSDVSSDFDQY